MGVATLVGFVFTFAFVVNLFVDVVVGQRVSAKSELEGLDLPEMGALGPKSLGGSPVRIHLYVEDVDSLYNQAVKAGAEIGMPLADQPWGDRYGTLTDPFGHSWGLATHIEDVSFEEVNRRFEAACAGR